MTPRWRAPAGQSLSGAVVFGDVIQIADVAGDVAVTAGHSPYRVTPFPVEAEPLSVERARAQPSRLLLPRHQVVPFAGRDSELAEFAEWMAAPESMAVRLVHAAGGQGKTRLAGQIAANCAGAGWAVWRVLHTPTSAGTLAMPAQGGVLVVVDYADRWPPSELLALLGQLHGLTLRSGVVVRALLLARSAGYWWSAVAHELESTLDVRVEVDALAPLGDGADRGELFRTAHDAFAAAMGVERDVRAPSWLDEARVLSVHMAALVAVDAGAAPSDSPHAVSAYLLRREQAYWATLPELSTPPTVLGRAVFVATLVGALPRARAIEVLARVSLGGDGVIDDHRVCYPAENPLTVLEALQPDRLGEDMLALSLPGHGVDWAADDWTLDAVRALADVPGVVTVLVETARRWPHVATGVLYPLVREHPELAIAAGGATLIRLADLPGIEIDVLEEVDDQLPANAHVDLDVAMAAITTVLTEHRLASATDPIERAWLNNNLSWRLANAGRHDEALLPAQKAVEGYREVADTHPVDLALALGNLGSRLSDLGRPEEAWQPSQEAVEILRQQPQAEPDILANALGNLGIRFADQRRWEEALACTVETLEVYRDLVSTDRDSYLPNFATALDNIGQFLHKLGHRAEAVDSTAEAVGIWRQLTEIAPAHYLPRLANCLNSRGVLLSELGLLEAGLASTMEAVEIQRRLVENNSAVYLSYLASSLHNLGNLLFEMGRLSAASSSIAEAVEIRRQLAVVSPAVELPGLAHSLMTLGVRLAFVGQWEAALAATTESVEVYRRLAQADPGLYLPELAVSVRSLGTRLSDVGRLDEAAELTEEAVDLHGRVPTPDHAERARAFNSLGISYARLRRWEEATESTEAAVAIQRELAAETSAVHLLDLAGSLGNLCVCLAESGRTDEGLVLAEEAVGIFRRMADLNPEGDTFRLAKALTNLCAFRAGTGRVQEALESAREAVGIFRRLVEADPVAHRSGYAGSLRSYAQVCLNLGVELPEARVAAREAIDIYRPLAERLPDRFGPQLQAAIRLRDGLGGAVAAGGA